MARTPTGRHNHHFENGRCRTCRSWCASCQQCYCQTDAEYGTRVRAEMAAGQAVHEGKAFGGPRDGIKLTASSRWDGKMTGNEDGQYTWAGFGWQWKPTPARARRSGRSRR